MVLISLFVMEVSLILLGKGNIKLANDDTSVMVLNFQNGMYTIVSEYILFLNHRAQYCKLKLQEIHGTEIRFVSALKISLSVVCKYSFPLALKFSKRYFKL